MLKAVFIPTPLFPPGDRHPVDIVECRPPGRLDRFRLIFFLASTLPRWLGYWLYRRLGGAPDIRILLRRLRLDLEQLGILWIKTGQLLAMRRDLFPGEFCDELSKLHDSASGVPFSFIEATIESELASPLADVFSEFDTTPIAAASIGQVHRARLRLEDREVAVKIQRPYVAAQCKRDLRSLRRLFGMLERFGVWPHARWLEMCWQLERTMQGELDYRFEAASLRMMRKTLRHHKVYCPKVFSKRSTERVLTMEFIHGVSMCDLIRAALEQPARLRVWTVENNIYLPSVGRKLYETHARQVFEDNLFHCDLHPGNIVLLRHGRLALIDFGAVGRIEVSQLRKYYEVFQATADRDYTKVAERFLLLVPAMPYVTEYQLDIVKGDIVKAMQNWETRAFLPGLPYHQKSLTSAIQGISNVFRLHRIPFTWDFMQVNRAELTMDASLAFLIPEANYFELIEGYRSHAWPRTIRRSFNSAALRKQVAGLLSSTDLLGDLAERSSLEGEMTRRRALRIAPQPSAAALPLSMLAGLSAKVLLLIGIIALVGGVDSFISTPLGRLCLRLIARLWPALSMAGAGWQIAAAITILYLAHVFSKLASGLRGSGVRLAE